MISFVYIILQMAPPEVGQLIMKIMPKLVSTANNRAGAGSNEGVPCNVEHLAFARVKFHVPRQLPFL